MFAYGSNTCKICTLFYNFAAICPKKLPVLLWISRIHASHLKKYPFFRKWVQAWTYAWTFAFRHLLAGCLNTLRPRQNGRHFADDTFERIFVNENVWILIEISLKFFPKGPINNIPALVQIMVWRRPGDKPLSEPMMVFFTGAYMRHSASMS